MSDLGQWLFEQQKAKILAAVDRRQPRTGIVQTVSADSVTVTDPLTGTAESQLLPVLGQLPTIGQRVVIMPLSDGSRVAIKMAVDTEPVVPPPASNTITVKDAGTSLGPFSTLDFDGSFTLGISGSELDVYANPTRLLHVGPPYDGGHVQGGRALYLSTHLPLGTLAGVAMTANRLYYVPIWVPKDLTTDGTIFECTTFVAGSVQLGIYTCSSSFLPDTLVALGTKTAVASIGVKVFASGGAALSGGRWYFVGICSTSAMSIRGSVTAANLPSFRGGSDQNGSTVYLIAYQDLAAGWANLPASASASSNSNAYFHVGVTV